MTKSQTDIATAITILIIAVLAFIFFPMFTIMAINALFATGIPINFYTWLASLWITATFAPVKYAFKKD